MFKLLSLFTVLVGGVVTDCSNGGALFKLSSMSFSPDPPVAGENSTLLLSMTVPAQISGGSASYSLTYNFIPFAPTTEDLCTTLPSGCPIMAGQLNTKSEVPIDKGLSGSVSLKIKWTDLTDRNLLCVLVSMKVGDAAKQLALRGTYRDL